MFGQLNSKKLRTKVMGLVLVVAVSQNIYAMPHFGLMMHHIPGNSHPFHGKLANHFGIPKIPASENNLPEFEHQLRVMHNLYKMDKTIVDVYPGPFERKLLRRAHDNTASDASSSESY